MKILSDLTKILFIVFIFFAGCQQDKSTPTSMDASESKPVDRPNIVSMLRHQLYLETEITDKYGQPTTVFYRRDTMYVKNVIVNKKKNEQYLLIVPDSGPLLENAIYQGEQHIWGELDGLCFCQIVTQFILEKSERLEFIHKIYLPDSLFTPGDYILKTKFRFHVDKYERLPDLELAFTIR